MRQARKEALLHSFPAVSARFVHQMQDGKSSENFAVMLTRGDELFVRCFHRFSRGYKNALVEVQRYVFAKDGSVRYGADEYGRWSIRKDVREPVFYHQPYGYANNSYKVLNISAIEKSCVKYCRYEDAPNLLIEYLHLYCKHPNVEYLLKSGYKHLIVARCTGWWSQNNRIECSRHINWKSNNLLKMLGLNRDEFKLLAGHEKYYEAYVEWREVFPKIKPEGLLTIAEQFKHEQGSMQNFCMDTGLKPDRIARYLKAHKIPNWEYNDYLSQCRKLKYARCFGAKTFAVKQMSNNTSNKSLLLAANNCFVRAEKWITEKMNEEEKQAEYPDRKMTYGDRQYGIYYVNAVIGRLIVSDALHGNAEKTQADYQKITDYISILMTDPSIAAEQTYITSAAFYGEFRMRHTEFAHNQNIIKMLTDAKAAAEKLAKHGEKTHAALLPALNSLTYSMTYLSGAANEIHTQNLTKLLPYLMMQL